MELEVISNDHDRFIYTEGHVGLEEMRRAVEEDGYTTKNNPRHCWLVEGEVPEEYREEFGSWFTFCDEGTERAFPVTCLTL